MQVFGYDVQPRDISQRAAEGSRGLHTTAATRATQTGGLLYQRQQRRRLEYGACMTRRVGKRVVHSASVLAPAEREDHLQPAAQRLVP